MSTEVNDWQEKNAAYLSASLKWLRLKLISLVNAANRDDPAAKASEDLAVEEAFAEVTAMESEGPVPSLVLVKQQFALSAFEQGILLMAAAVELDTGIPALYARVQDDASKNFPTFALAMLLFGDASWNAISSQGPLRYWHLVEVNAAQQGQPMLTSLIRVDERMVNFIRGLNYPDDRIVRVSSPFLNDAMGEDISPSQLETANELKHGIQVLRDRGRAAIVQLTGSDAASKQAVAQRIAGDFQLTLINLEPALLMAPGPDLEEFIRLWQRESRLLPLAGYIDLQKADYNRKNEMAGVASEFAMHRLLLQSEGIMFLATREVYPDLFDKSLVAEIQKPTPAEQQQVWAETLGDNADNSPMLLAAQFNLNSYMIRDIVLRTNDGSMAQQALHAALWKACLLQSSPDLDLLVQRIDLKASWDDIVLPQDSLNQLKQIASQVKFRSQVYDDWGFRQKMNRGLGINALFVGESGTGKTMAAEVLANELNLHLYRIDLSGVVSKYIGETEKNLRRVFDAAENGGAILFFDEADALFGKRSEVKDSHDRYANIEVNYLLQRMESFNGLAILATNKKAALDDAFTRRLRFVIHFPFPGTRERRAIVKKAFPDGVPKRALDYDKLAALNLTGGNIFNIAINAAFDAAEKNTEVSMPIILAAARAEFQKIDRPVKEADFGWTEKE